MNCSYKKRRGISTIEFCLVLTLISVFSFLSISAVMQAVRSPLSKITPALGYSGGASEEAPPERHQVDSSGSNALMFGFIGLGVVAFGLFFFNRTGKPDSTGNQTKRLVVNELEAMLCDSDPNEACCKNAARKRKAILRALLANAACHSQTCLTVGEIMTSEVTFVAPETKCAHVRKVMKKNGLRHLVVCDAHGLKGIISDRDLVNQTAKFAKQMMTTSPLFATTSDNVSFAIDVMLSNRISCLPVLEGKRIVGIMTVTDLTVTLQCILGLFGKLLWTGGATE